MTSRMLSIRSTAVSATLVLAVGAASCGGCVRDDDSPGARTATGRVWMNRELPPGERASALVAMMTQQEKLTMVHGAGDGSSSYVGHIPAIPRLDIPALNLMDGPAGVSQGMTGVTAFPAPLTVAASWDVELVESWATAMAEEEAGKGVNVHLAPMMNLVRMPHGGRSFEGSGEDPFLTAEMAAASVRGIQGQGVIATAKHFIDNDQEHSRFDMTSEIDLRTQHEIYLPPFRASVRAGAGAIMCAFNRINGVFSCENDAALNGLLKGELGFSGFVMSDWYPAVHHTVPAANGGMDMEMQGGPGTDFDTALAQAVASGEVPQARLDDMVTRILTSMFAAGLFDRAPSGSPGANVTSPAHTKVTRDGAAQGTVLLKNAGNLLPLDPASVNSIAVIGSVASSHPIIVGGGSAQVTPSRVVSALAGIQARAGNGTTVSYVAGDSVDQPVPTSALRTPSGQPGLLGQYYANRSRSGDPVLTRTDANVDFDWHGGSPGPGIPSSNWSARWTGKLIPPTTGDYRLVLSSDDGSRLHVDGAMTIDNSGDHGERARSASMHLEGGRAYDIEIEFDQGGGDDVVHFYWLEPDQLDFAQARAAAQAADVAVVVVGTTSSEGGDRADLALPGVQDGLVAAVAQANPRTVVVVYAPAQILMPWADAVDSILFGWIPGQEVGDALAALLYGDENPSGKLPVTIARQTSDYPTNTPEQYPGVNGRVVYSEGLRVGYRHFDARSIEPLFPFGHGLSYTKFVYTHLAVTPGKAISASGSVQVTFDVKNEGARAGAEVAQVYLGMPVEASEPPRQLRCFDKLRLSAGQSEKVTCTLDAEAFSFWSAGIGQWVAYPGTYSVLVGSSSRDIRLEGSFVVEGGPLAGEIVQAEGAALAGGATVGSDTVGFTGTGFVAAGPLGASATIDVEVASAGEYALTLRYAGGRSEHTLGLTVNGAPAADLTLPALANPEMWDFARAVVELKAGTNTIAYRHQGGEGELALDALTVLSADALPGTGPDAGPGENMPEPGGGCGCSVPSARAAAGGGGGAAALLILAVVVVRRRRRR